MKKTILLLLLSVFFLSSCLVIKPLELRNVDQIKTNFDATGGEVKFMLHVHNPNSIGVKISKFETRMSLDSMQAGMLAIPQNFRIPRMADVDIPVTMNTTADELVKLFGNGLYMLFGKENPFIMINGSITLRKFIFHRTYTVQYREPVNLKGLKLGK